MRKHVAAVLAVVSWLGGAMVAQAQPGQPDANDPAMTMTETEMAADDEQARAHFRVGRQRYEEGRFAEAARDFQEAYNLSRRAALLYNVYVAWRDAGDKPMAAEALRQYLAGMPPELPERASLEARLRSLDEEIAQNESLQAQANEARARADEERRQREAAEARAREEEARRRQAERGDPTFGWILTASGGALLVGSAITGILALGRVGELEDNCPGDRCRAGFDLEGERRSARNMVRITDILWISGAAIAATGLVLVMLSGGDDEEEAAAPAAGAMCGPDGCSAEMRVRF
jgi:tetratricopeptide (TPR) repeat protein